LGKGNFAKVYYTKNNKTGKVFAVKVFEKDLFE
jgi:serine/threonine protein kinase